MLSDWTCDVNFKMFNLGQPNNNNKSLNFENKPITSIYLFKSKTCFLFMNLWALLLNPCMTRSIAQLLHLHKVVGYIILYYYLYLPNHPTNKGMSSKKLDCSLSLT
jgi:hypothetical protein